MVVQLNQKTYFLITGASRGIGQRFAVEVASKLKEGSVVVLLARNEDGLAKTKAEIEARSPAQVHTYSIDMYKATAEQFRELLTNSLKASGEEATNFERAFIIHNAGTLGDVSKRAIDISDTEVWTRFFHLNLFSAISLNCEFFRQFSSIPKLVVNLSTKCSVVPFASMTAYCTSRAARDMYFKVLAVEQSSDTVVLNYSPGMVDTDMTVTLQHETINPELSSAFQQQRETKTILTAEQTTKKFLEILEAQKFKSGDRVDFND